MNVAERFSVPSDSLLCGWLMLLWVKPILSCSSSMLANRPQISINRNSTTKKNKGFHTPSKLDHKALTNQIFPSMFINNFETALSWNLAAN